jgi:hypothetical protein
MKEVLNIEAWEREGEEDTPCQEIREKEGEGEVERDRRTKQDDDIVRSCITWGLAWTSTKKEVPTVAETNKAYVPTR